MAKTKAAATAEDDLLGGAPAGKDGDGDDLLGGDAGASKPARKRTGSTRKAGTKPAASKPKAAAGKAAGKATKPAAKAAKAAPAKKASKPKAAAAEGDRTARGSGKFFMSLEDKEALAKKISASKKTANTKELAEKHNVPTWQIRRAVAEVLVPAGKATFEKVGSTMQYTGV